MNIVIVGGSAAGLAAAETLRSKNSEVSITIVTDETEPGYARCMIPEILAGAKKLADIYWRTNSFYRENNVCIIKGTRVVSLEPAIRRVLLDNGQKMPYDRILMATGASPAEPAGRGAGGGGIFTLRTYRQAWAIGKAAGMAKQAVVAGGGLVGLKAACALRKRGVHQVTLLVKSPYLLVRQLDEDSAAMLGREMHALGIDCIFGVNPQEYLSDPATGRVRSVMLDNGREMPTDIVLAGKGVLPNTSLVRNAGGVVSKGIKVDDYMQTTLPGVFAAGDCIEVNDLLTGRAAPSGLWPLAVEQGRCAALNMLGRRRVYPRPVTRLNAAQFGRLPLVSVGHVHGAGDAVGAVGEFTVHVSSSASAYRKLVFEQDRLVGCIMLGNIDRAGVYTAVIKRAAPVNRALKNRLLDGNVCAADVMGIG